MTTFKRSAEQYLGISSDLTNTTIDATTVFVSNDLVVNGSISSGGATGATGSGDFTVQGDLTVQQSTFLKGGLGCTGTATFYGQINGRSFLFGISPYLFISVNNASNTYTAVSNQESIFYAMINDEFESSSNGLVLQGSGATNTYIEPNAAGVYVLSFFGRLKDGDDGQNNGVVPYIYQRDLSPASWIVSATEPQFMGTLYGTRCSINYEQTILIPSAGDTRVDLRAFTTAGTFNIAFASTLFRYVSSL
jgi:hypothetical protein